VSIYRGLGTACACLGLTLALSLIASPVRGQTYVAFGDSITEGVGDNPTLTAKGYPPRLEGLLSAAGRTATVLNRGVPGEDTSEGLSRIDEVLRRDAPDVILLMEGTNDIAPGLSEETTRFNLDEMAEKAERRGIEVVHATLIPRIPSARQDSSNMENQRLNEEIRDLAGQEGRGLADPFEVFGSQTNLFNTYYDRSSPNDPVGHPNEAGHDLMARIFADVILDSDTVPPVTGIMDPINGAQRVVPGKTIRIGLWDFGAGIDLANTTLLIGGSAVQAVQSGSASGATLTYDPPSPLSGVITVGLRSRDLATPANSVDRTISRFIIRGTVFLDGDVDQDGRVDGADLVDFGRRFGATAGTNRYIPRADFNNDRVIDGEDLAILAANFGESNF